jgi:hypothetical protein
LLWQMSTNCKTFVTRCLHYHVVWNSTARMLSCDDKSLCVQDLKGISYRYGVYRTADDLPSWSRNILPVWSQTVISVITKT